MHVDCTEWVVSSGGTENTETAQMTAPKTQAGKQNARRFKLISRFALTGAVLVFLFQNCSNNMSFVSVDDPMKALDVTDTPPPVDETTPPGDLGVCEGVSCDLDPLTTAPAVTTILMALGDEADDQLVINGASSQLIAETVIRYTSPKVNPKILFVQDDNVQGESPEDTQYAINVLLKRYDVSSLDQHRSGLTPDDVAGFDIIWFNNPGHPMGSVNTRNTLLGFSGGVVIQGDDMTRGDGFSTEELTGLRHIDNGSSVTCDGVAYAHDNNMGQKFRVSLDAAKIPGANESTISFFYGNDIDNSVPTRPDLEILATAKGGPETCTEDRPAIVRYLKTSPLAE